MCALAAFNLRQTHDQLRGTPSSTNTAIGIAPNASRRYSKPFSSTFGAAGLSQSNSARAARSAGISIAVSPHLAGSTIGKSPSSPSNPAASRLATTTAHAFPCRRANAITFDACAPRTASGRYVALTQQLRQMRAQRQHALHHRELHPAIVPARQKLRRRCLRQPRLAFGKIDGPAIVGIDQTEVPQLGALIKIGNPRRRQPQHRLLQTVERTRAANPRDERGQLAQEPIAPLRRQDVEQEIAAAGFIRFVGCEPVGLQLRFPQRLQLPLRDALGQFLDARFIVRL